MAFRITTGVRAALATAALLIFTGAAGAQHFVEPTNGAQRLDWCRAWATDCGRGAADAFCRILGYGPAVDFAIDADIGASQPTRVLDGGQVCADAGCDGFAYITCGASPTTRFDEPMQGAQRLDWCRVWGGDCGAGAAQAFCVSRGFGRAVDFAIDPDIGASQPTRVIGTGQVCADGGCDGFAYIVCE